MFGTLHFWFLVRIKKKARRQSVGRTSQRMSYFYVMFMRWSRAMLCAIPTIKNDMRSQYDFWRCLSLSPFIFYIQFVAKHHHSSIIVFLPSLFFLLFSQILIILCLNNDDILLAQWISDISLRRWAGQGQSFSGTRENEKIRTRR